MKRTQIGLIGNYYGGLHVMEIDDKYYWIIENHSTDFGDLNDYDEIDKELYESLMAYEERRNK